MSESLEIGYSDLQSALELSAERGSSLKSKFSTFSSQLFVANALFPNATFSNATFLYPDDFLYVPVVDITYSFFLAKVLHSRVSVFQTPS